MAFSAMSSHTGPSDEPSTEARLAALMGTSAWHVATAGGAVAIVAGVLALVWPGVTLAAAGLLFGVFLLAYGVTQIIGAFGPHAGAAYRGLLILSGTLSALLGLMCFRSPAQSLLLLAFWIGFGWILRGVTLAASALSDARANRKGLRLALAAITVIAGLTVVVWPFSSVATLTFVAGVWLIVTGVMEISHGVTLRRISEAPDSDL
jgi:uncharacterized membrane protein HdeD (DUF308 family)